MYMKWVGGCRNADSEKYGSIIGAVSKNFVCASKLSGGRTAEIVHTFISVPSLPNYMHRRNSTHF